MEILLAIAILTGYLILHGHDRSASRRFAAAAAEDAASMESWLPCVYNEDAFWEVRQMLNEQIDGRGRKEHPEIWPAVYQEVMAAYREMGWAEIRGKYTPDASEFWFTCLDGLYFDRILQAILLANRGMLGEMDARYGIRFDAAPKTQAGHNSPFQRVTNTRERNWYAIQMKHDKMLGHYIVKKLREHGITDDVYFIPERLNLWAPETVKVYSFGTEPDTIPGRLVFYPALPQYLRDHIV